MKLDIKTLTKEQRKQLDLGYNIYLNDNNKLVTEEPISVTPEFIEYKTEIINKEFQNSISQFTSDYSQAEIDMFGKQTIGADKYLLDGTITKFFENLKQSDETYTELANGIKIKEEAFEIASATALRIKKETIKDLETN